MGLKDKVKKLRNSDNYLVRMIYYLLKPLWVLRRFFTDGFYRSVVFTRLTFRKRYFQQSAYTKPGRYPAVFTACTSYLRPVANSRILSFGCATGEEATTLAEYMPGAMITGVDINDWCIAQCKEKYPEKRFRFLARYSAEFTDSGGYDAIFCMAVFQHTDNRKNIDTATALTFRQYEDEIIMLDAKLKPGGLFVTDHCDFSFTDSVVADRYKPLDCNNNLMERRRPLFDRYDRKIADSQKLSRIFVKLENRT